MSYAFMQRLEPALTDTRTSPIKCRFCNTIYNSEMQTHAKSAEFKTYQLNLRKHIFYKCVECNKCVKLCCSIPNRITLEPLHLDCAVSKWHNV